MKGSAPTMAQHTLTDLMHETPPPNGQTHVYNVRFGKNTPAGTRLLTAAALLLLLLAAAMGYVSWRAQYGFIYAAKHDHLASALEALGLDVGAVIFALLGLAHATMGHPARIERALNLTCAFGSMTMNLLSGDLGSPRSVAVYVLPAALYAACSDRLIATAGHAAGVRETSVWRYAGLTVLYALRVVAALPSTASGMRRKLLQLTPLPEAPGRGWEAEADRERAEHASRLRQAEGIPALGEGSGAAVWQEDPDLPDASRNPAIAPARESKKSVLLRLYATHPDRADRSKVSKVAAELAPQAGLQPGSARTYLYALHPTVDGTDS